VSKHLGGGDERATPPNGLPTGLPNGLPNDWPRLEPLIDAVLDAPPDRRDAIALELSAGDTALYHELRRLVAECARDHRLFDLPAVERFGSLLDDDAVPAVLAGRYQLTREVGRGGMARVYQARDLKHSRDVAVKVLSPDFAAFVGPARFLKEIEIVARLQHPHIVPLHDSGESDGLLFYVMPYEEGLSLRRRLDHDEPIPLGEVIAILRDVCEALMYAHAHGIVHRDIKPDNVLLSANHALVADFGIARLMTDTASDVGAQTVPGMVIGTPAYMAPEQAVPNVRVDHRADLYAFGVLAYELLVGKPPFTGDSHDVVLAAHLIQAPQSVRAHHPSVPVQLDELVMRCLAKEPADRWQTADEILRQLEQVGSVKPQREPVVSRWRRMLKPGPAGGIAGLALLGLGAWWQTRDRLDLDPNRVAVVRFRNATGVDSMDVFGSIIADVVTNGLARTEGVNVAPAAAVLSAVAPRTANPPPNDPASIARATGAGIIVTGSYFVRPDSLAVQAEIIDVARGRPLTPIDLLTVPFADQQRAVLGVLDRVAVALAGRLNPRIADAAPMSDLPMSMAAYREYAEGVDRTFRGEEARALRHFYRALDLDSTSASALLWAALTEWRASGNLPKVDALLRRVEPFQRDLAPYDLAQFDWLRAYLDGDLDGVRSAARPPDLMLGSAAVQASMRLNRIDEAYALISDVMKKRPAAEKHPINWQFLTQILHMRGEHRRELREASKGLAEMKKAAADAAVADLLEYKIRALAALGRVDELRPALDELHALRPTSGAFASAARELRWHSHPDSARAVGRLAEQWYREALTHSSDRPLRLAFAETLFELERWDEARTAFAALAAEDRPSPSASQRVRTSEIAAVAYLGIDDARQSDTAAADAVIERLGELDGPFLFGERPYWQARVAARLGQCERAVAYLQEALANGTSVFDELRLEASDFKQIETCAAFKTLQASPR
jgi:TolB-like protein